MVNCFHCDAKKLKNVLLNLKYGKVQSEWHYFKPNMQICLDKLVQNCCLEAWMGDGIFGQHITQKCALICITLWSGYGDGGWHIFKLKNELCAEFDVEICGLEAWMEDGIFLSTKIKYVLYFILKNCGLEAWMGDSFFFQHKN